MGSSCWRVALGCVCLAPHLPVPSPRPSPAQRERGERLWRSMRQGLLFSGWAFRPLKRPLSRE